MWVVSRANAPDFSELPSPLFYFRSSEQPPKATNAGNCHFFSLLPAQNEGCVMFAKPRPGTTAVTVYDPWKKTVIAMRPARFLKPANSITLSTTSFPKQPGRRRRQQSKESPTGEQHGLYVINTDDGSFEIFNYRMTPDLSAYHHHWYWQRDRPHVPQCVPYVPYTGHTVGSAPFAAAAVDGSTICASTKDGTYAFDVSSRGEGSQNIYWVHPHILHGTV